MKKFFEIKNRNKEKKFKLRKNSKIEKNKLIYGIVTKEEIKKF